MGQQVNLLRSLPQSCRNVSQRQEEKSPETIRIARQYGYEYFDGPRKYGYGGYYYDGRWRSVARDIVAHYKLGPGARVLDVGCAKGFLVADLLRSGIDAYGLDISRYAVTECPHPEVIGRLHLGTACSLPFPANSFDLVLSINTLHNLPLDGVKQALQEMGRVSRGHMFVQVDSYRTAEEQARFEAWVLTAETHGTPEFWLWLFVAADYDGDYDWTIV